MQRRVYYIIIGIIIIFASCSRRPGYVMPPDKMTEVLYDLRLTQSIYTNDNQFRPDEMKDALVESVLEKHKITQAELDSSLLWYSDNVQYYAIISDTVASRLKAKNESLIQSRSAFENKRRQSNLLLPTFYYLSNYTPTLSFDIDTLKMKNLKNISNFHLKLDIYGLSADQKAEAAVYFNYKDTLVIEKIPIIEDNHYSIKKPLLPDSLLKSISGYIHLQSKISNAPEILIHNISYIDSAIVSVPKDNLPARPDRSSDNIRRANRDQQRPEDIKKVELKKD